MTPQDGLKELLQQVRQGSMSVEAALDFLRFLPYQDLGFAKIDHHRCLRSSLPEVIFSPGKTPEQVASIARCLADKGGLVIATKADELTYQAVRQVLPDARFFPTARIISWGPSPAGVGKGSVAVISGGTADQSIAEEAAVCLDLMGHEVSRLYDVGVAGLHRLLENLPLINPCQVLIVVAGMEGALASVVAGLVRQPVIALPTSVGYGSSFGGLAALLTMLNSCAPGIGVVNIDNGFGAAALAHAVINAAAGPGRNGD